ncbi:MAG: macro domain-containing protein [Acidimicrobiia bacterium]
MDNEVGRKDVGGARIVVVEGDLTAQHTEAIVNAANEHLQHGGGVAAAIAGAGGKDIQEESDRWVAEHGPVATGTAAVTTGGTLPARWLVHAVGPRYRQGQDNEGLLRRAVSAALDTAAAHGARSVAFPAISAGVFGYPRPEATAAIADQVAGWLEAHPGELEEVRLVGYDRATAEEFAAGL